LAFDTTQSAFSWLNPESPGFSGAGIATHPAMSLLAQPCLSRLWWNLIEDNATKVRKSQSFWALPLPVAANNAPIEINFEHPGKSIPENGCHNTGHFPIPQ
jgi:hypothetical protein